MFVDQAHVMTNCAVRPGRWSLVQSARWHRARHCRQSKPIVATCSHRWWCLSDAIGAADPPPILSEVPRPINLPRAASARHAENRLPCGAEAAVAHAAAALLAALADLCPHMNYVRVCGSWRRRPAQQSLRLGDREEWRAASRAMRRARRRGLPGHRLLPDDDGRTTRAHLRRPLTLAVTARKS